MATWAGEVLKHVVCAQRGGEGVQSRRAGEQKGGRRRRRSLNAVLVWFPLLFLSLFRADCDARV